MSIIIVFFYCYYFFKKRLCNNSIGTVKCRLQSDMTVEVHV